MWIQRKFIRFTPPSAFWSRIDTDTVQVLGDYPPLNTADNRNDIKLPAPKYFPAKNSTTFLSWSPFTFFVSNCWMLNWFVPFVSHFSHEPFNISHVVAGFKRFTTCWHAGQRGFHLCLCAHKSSCIFPEPKWTEWSCVYEVRSF